MICNNLKAYAIFFFKLHSVPTRQLQTNEHVAVGVVCCRLVLPSIVLIPKYRFDRDVENGGVV